MKTFADSALSFIATRPDAAQRQLSWQAFQEEGLPSTSDEVWRYAPLKDLDLDTFVVSSSPEVLADSVFAAQLCARAGLVVRVVDGYCVDSGASLDGISNAKK